MQSLSLLEVKKNGPLLQELGFKVSCVVNGEDASPTVWAGVLGKAVWQLFWGLAMTRRFSDL